MEDDGGAVAASDASGSRNRICP